MATEPEGSITRLAGEAPDEAARRLWDRYFDRLVRLARSRLRGRAGGPADEEDAALSAFDSLCRGVAAGRFRHLDGREDLWRLLATITARKAADQLEREGRKKRGGDRRRAEIGAEPGGGRDDAGGLSQLPGAAPTPEFVALMGEEVRRLFELLPDDTLRVMALLKMEGYTNEEIAASLDCALRSVERKLERIRLLWSAGGPSS
jgi:DNA-directed RNA polymerase specialized sigma24 family protein